uniref:integumentary mucin C.1-like n=1 Tax=Styela clava TaxID=7725 RepID=UPI0019395ECC|nr:integumentary mucin C.1-like [Styela clava]
MKLFLIACLCYMFFATGYAVMCYQCQNCGDNKKLNASQLIQCSNSTCQTNTTRGYVVRTCGDHNLTTGCNTVTNGSLNFEVCVCEGDGCNGLDTNSPTVAITTSTNEPTTSTNEPTTSTNEPTTSTNEPTTSITELITSIAELITSNAGFVEFGTNESTTLTSEPTTSGAGTIKSSKIVGSVISLLVAKCIII